MSVFITGFAGTVGRAFTEYMIADKESVTGVDNNEWAVASFPKLPRLTKHLGDFANFEGRYGLTIHCAAYKHVDLIEDNRAEAFENNVVKLRALLMNIDGPFLFISTDKAVEPTSYYGETKLWGEDIVKQAGGIIARMGNIMGSSGSVIPIWEKALADGKPLPITDPTMTRYMLPVEEAVGKIMHLLPHARAGQVIIPEMGEPKGLLDILDEVTKKHGINLAEYEPGIEDIGIRPGEKLHEKLKKDTEKIVFSNKSGIIVEE